MLEWLDLTVYGKVTWLTLIMAVLAFFVALLASKLITFQMRRALKEKINKEHLEMLAKIISYGIMIIVIIWIMPNIGIEPSGLMVAGGIVALAIGFASQSIIGNLISGLFLMGERPVKIGDFVEISGKMGVVEDIHIISTSIRTLDGLYIRVPNETVFTSSITNYSSSPVRRFEYTVGIRYSDDAMEAKRIIMDVISKYPLALVNPQPLVFVNNLGDNGVDIIILIWAPTSVWYDAYMELLLIIKTAIEGAGIEIPFPQRVIWHGSSETKEQLQAAIDSPQGQ